MKKERREFIKESLLATAGIALTGGRSYASPREDRPNVLIVLDDQERHPLHTPPLKLPQRERLRKSSVEFTNAYCSFPLCSPSRATLMTGLHPHQAGINGNVDFNQRSPSLPVDVPNLANVFKHAGYETGYFGKWHLTRRVKTTGGIERYGFTDGHISNQIIGLGADSIVTDNAAKWLRSKKRDKPWLMIYSPINPHDICYYRLMAELYRNIEKRDIKMPPNYEEDISHHPEAHWRFIQDDPLAKTQLPRKPEGFVDYLRFYLRLIELIDGHLGVVLDALEESGQWNDTIVVFTSDHGEMGGSHGLVNKGFIYEECMHIPLWISAPWLISENNRRATLTSNLDIVPTIAELAGVKWPTDLPGQALHPQKKDDEIEAPSRFFCSGSGSGSLKFCIPWRGIVGKDWKYCLWLNGDEELYNRGEDPLEMNNLAGAPSAAHLKQNLKSLVNQWRGNTGDPRREYL